MSEEIVKELTLDGITYQLVDTEGWPDNICSIKPVVEAIRLQEPPLILPFLKSKKGTKKKPTTVTARSVGFNFRV